MNNVINAGILPAPIPKPKAIRVDFNNIPLSLRNIPIFVMWRYVFKNSKWTKPPFQINGGFAKTTDPLTWATYDSVKTAYKNGGFDGIGVMLRGDIVGIDLDHVITGSEVKPWALDIITQFKNTYIEYSPSGDGLHILTTGSSRFTGKRGENNSLEVYDHTSPRYFTITGQIYPHGQTELNNAQNALDLLASKYDVKKESLPQTEYKKDAISIIQAIQNSKFKDRFNALNNGNLTGDHSADDLAFCNLIAIFTDDVTAIDFIVRQSKFRMRDKWDEVHFSNGKTYGEATLDKAIAAKSELRAQNLLSAKTLFNPIIAGNHSHPLAMYRDFDVDNHKPQEFILDDKIQVGIVLLAGGHGCGKTTQLVPLLCRATHLCLDDALKPTLKRKIIYVTEDPNQVERILHSMWVSREFGNSTKDDIKTMFKVVEAKRMHARDIVKVADIYLKETVTNINKKTGLIHDAKPLVVVDTINATIHLENDNDNSEVGEVVATFKQEFKGLPVLLIAHLAKGLLRSEIEGLTARGAGAWEADAHQVLYLVKEDNGTRWLDISYPKHRFHSDADGILFESVTNDISTTDILGNLKNEKLIHGRPSLVCAGGKKMLKDTEALKKHNREMQALSEKICSTAKEMLKNQAYITRNEIHTLIGCNRQTVFNVINGLIKLGVLTENEIPKDNRRNQNQKSGIQLPSAEVTEWDISRAGTA